MRCEQCHAEKLVAFSCKKRGFCPSCGGRRMAESAALLVDEVLPERPLHQWVLSLPHALRFLLATHPAAVTQVLGVVYRTISAHLLRTARLTRATGHTGAVTLIQRFGSALNLNIHFHMLFLDGVYLTDGAHSPVFRYVAAPGANELQGLLEQIAARVGQALEKRGLIERDIENAWLSAGAEPGPLDDLIEHSITYRIATGPRAGQKLFTLQTVLPRPLAEEADANGAVHAGGFSLHAGVYIAPSQREKLERLCRYVSRPPVATERLALTASDHVRYALKSPYRDGTTHIVLEPLDLMARLAALVPPPRMHLTRLHGVFAAHSKLRAAVTPAHRGTGAARQPPAELGTAAQAGVRHRDRALHPLRWHARDHRQHRGARSHREDPLAPAAHGAASVSARAATRGTGAAGAVEPDLKTGRLGTGLGHWAAGR